MKNNDRQYLPNSDGCFVCGEDNPAGLQTRFYVEDDIVMMDLDPEPHHCGYPNILHGGVAAAAIDECMGWAASRAIKRMCVTGELTIRYLQPIPGDKKLVVHARAIEAHRRMVHAEAHLQDEEGILYAKGSGRFLPLSVKETLAVDDGMRYRGDEERIFDELREEKIVCNRKPILALEE